MAIIMANPLTNPDRFFAELSGRGAAMLPVLGGSHHSCGTIKGDIEVEASY
jgi:hypothetical protein